MEDTNKTLCAPTRTQEKRTVIPQEIDPDLSVHCVSMNVQESLVEGSVSSGMLQGQGH